MFRSIICALVLFSAACTPEPPSAEAVAFSRAIASYCGPALNGYRTCSAYLVTPHRVLLVVSVSTNARVALAILHNRHGVAEAMWVHLSSFQELGYLPYTIVGPHHANYEATREQFLGRRM